MAVQTSDPDGTHRRRDHLGSPAMPRTRRVRRYLSSFRLGPHGHRLLPLVGTGVAPRSSATPSTGSRMLTVSAASGATSRSSPAPASWART